MKSGSRIEHLQSFELQLFELFARAVSNHHMIDVGAHHGDMLKPFVNAGWTVDAFEPIESNRKRMKERFSSHQNLTIHSEAVSNSSGHKDFHLALNSDGELHEYYHSLELIGLDIHHRKGTSIRIQTVALDDLVRTGRLPSKIGLLKIDTEGHDLAVLQGAGLVEADVISVEFWGDEHPLGKSPSPLPEIARLLNTQGYRSFIILCRRGEEMECRNSVTSVPPDSWGNAFFFRGEQAALYQECAEILQVNSTHSRRPGRLPEILRLSLPTTDFTFVDVGAYLGDFSERVLGDFPSATGLLFEPTDLSFQALTKRFCANTSVHVFNLALSIESGEAEFYMVTDSATNSLLGFKTPGLDPHSTVKPVETLDRVLQSQIGLPPVRLLKVDTQGNDLRVLQGARGVVSAHRPAILIEAIFVALYESQCSYYEIFEFMNDNHYLLAAVLEPHSTSEGLWAFADLLFVPAEKHASLTGTAEKQRDYVCTDSNYLLAQNRLLQSACDERLDLIHRLTETAAERLKVIEILDAEVKRLSGRGKG